MKVSCCFVLTVFLSAWQQQVALGDLSDHKYNDREHVELWVNKVRVCIIM